MIQTVRETVHQFTPGLKIVFLVFACMMSWLLVTFVLLSISPLLFGVSYGQIPGLLRDLDNPEARHLLMFMQGGSSLGLFAGGAMLYSYFADGRDSVLFDWTSQNTLYNFVFTVLGIIALLLFLPTVDLLERVNNAIVFPEFLSGIGDTLRMRQDEMHQQIEVLLRIENTADFIAAVVVLALIPAIGEEWVFRAKLQGLIQRFTGSAHGGIWVTSLIFALFHQQFFALLPMLFLALFLGYVYAYTRSLWVSVGIHFANNFTSLLVVYASGGSLESTPEISTTVYMVSGLCVLGTLLLLFFYRRKFGVH